MRGRQREQEETDTLAREERSGKGAGGVGMLDEEDFGDSARERALPQIEYRAPMVEFHLDLPTTTTDDRPVQEYEERPPMLRYHTQPPFLFPLRTSDSGSAFREEVWPPPRQESVFVDPLLHAPEDDLTRIVTDIMGQPQPTHAASSSTCTTSTSTPVPSSSAP
ncbi:hypothetical protein C8R46DRAFT_944118, partial [Mycena filopes]